MNILVVRIGRLGDIVMILPALKALKAQYPGARFYAMTTSDGMRLLNASGLIEPDCIWRYQHTLFQRLKDTRLVKCLLKQHHFEIIYCFERKPRILNLLPESARILAPSTELMHYSARCLALVNAATDKFEDEPVLAVKEAVKIEVTKKLLDYGITERTIVIGLHPTYSGFRKWFNRRENKHRLWPIQSFAMLAKKLQAFAREQGLDLKVVMDLLPEEQSIGEAIVKESQHSAILLNVCDNFKHYLALISRYNVLVVSNTGVMHLAAALNTPVVALFSKLHPADCGPYMHESRCRVLRAEDSEDAHSGLSSISVDKVLESVLQLIK